MSYGPNPWQQAHWDWRAAGNFICGGAGSGLILFAALGGAHGPALADVLVGALALIALGLMCVWLEIGRPWRALHVFFNPRTSWMSREAFTAVLLFPTGWAAATLAPGLLPLAAVLALFFLFCQGRMLRASRGIPAWREPMAASLIAASGLTEGAGLYLVSAALHHSPTRWLLIPFSVLLLVRALLWRLYRQRLDTHAAPPALSALDQAGRWLHRAGVWLPLALIAAVATGATPAAWSASLSAAAGLAATLAGAYLKYTLITRASYNQGFSLARLPVRGLSP